jgi:threonine aldolase
MTMPMAEWPAGPRRHFASDNWAGAHPEVIAALAAANHGHAPSYGEDAVTARAVSRIQALFGAPVSVHFVFNGTAANVLGLASSLKPWQAVICSEVSHLNVDECGAYERLAGGKLLTVPAPNGKLTPELVLPRLAGIGVVHSVQPAAISITQGTEYGTVYTAAEVAALSRLAREHGLILHMDGARLANAAAALGLAPGGFTTGAGVDILTLGGTKNGLIAGEAVIIADPDRAAEFGFVRKQGMQLASKMRFVAAQFDALLTDDLWLRSATHANQMAQRLYRLVRDVPGVEVTQRVEANAVFACIPPAAIVPLQQHFNFLVWNERTSEVRWMTAFDTTPGDVDAFAAAIAHEVGVALAGAAGAAR